ncbi:uncharacterized protein N7459_005390 [Penicillium hispanicum]|uniref:uncharacterized protein n=1 Tax=Penicillium hispanicum TaxID=1080232 RepID=UPI00254202C5|nr:uncharacterized protein N7459_005390 [Penicillium hispanicum]KAJ5585590.1 hypothetical protein N7459_005390 [Penicillium hispanicum]
MSAEVSNSDAQWKFGLLIHQSNLSSSANYTERSPFVELVEKHNSIVWNGGSGYAEPGDYNSSVAWGPFPSSLVPNIRALVMVKDDMEPIYSFDVNAKN